MHGWPRWHGGEHIASHAAERVSPHPYLTAESGRRHHRVRELVLGVAGLGQVYLAFSPSRDAYTVVSWPPLLIVGDELYVC